MNLALGMIRAEDHPANLMYWGVLAVGIIGVLVARMKAKGMAYALAATAGAQALAAAIALAAGLGSTARDLAQILLLNGFFVLLFLGSALLFRKAGASEGRA
jgi:CubicO group peptidase (beta-lactamase class C family)